MIPNELINLPDNPANEKNYGTRDCPTCDGAGYFDYSECCGAPLLLSKPDQICSLCREHAGKEVCDVCGGSGQIELTNEDIQDYQENETENNWQANREEK